ncbi:UDP-N-acetylmuramoyl-L-alanyl-D-glutamate--2,6-diaminopimelate ligase [Amphritea sp. HPY]|uniref:UDP-N-acetylmuramoyl-L-alanyl-D-glutamate--2, 6-diaminopimelate ligase n=1 Tax=Amphritea sp. HPY TaxID=3421652 RepID=UPI003D7CCB1D
MTQPMMTLGQLLQPFSDIELGSECAALAIQGLSQDSRAVNPGHLFLARTGVSHKGIDFVQSAVAEGAVAAIVNRAELAAAEPIKTAIPVIAVADVNRLIGPVAAQFYGNPSTDMKMVGVTGTNGKTSCAHYIAQMLEYAGETCGLIGTVGNGLLGKMTDASHTTPDAISLQKMLAELKQQGATAVVMEVSSHALDQHRVAGVEFDVAAFTNLSRDHLDYHGDMESYGAAKAQLFTCMGVPHRVINIDDDYGIRLAEIASGEPVLTFGETAEADVSANNVRLSADGIKADLSTPWGTLGLDTGLIGRFNLSNLLLAISVCGELGLKLEQIESAVNLISAVPGRMQLVQRRLPLVVVDYAHTPDALEKALQALTKHCQGNLWCVFGCGGDRDTGKRPEMARIAEHLSDRVVITSDNPRGEDPQSIIDMVLAGITEPDAVTAITLREQAIAYAVAELKEQDILLIAGKGHETYQEIKGVRMPFDDVAVANKALELRVVK